MTSALSPDSTRRFGCDKLRDKLPRIMDIIKCWVPLISHRIWTRGGAPSLLKSDEKSEVPTLKYPYSHQKGGKHMSHFLHLHIGAGTLRAAGIFSRK